MSEQSSSSKTLTGVADQKTQTTPTGYSIPKPDPNLSAENQDPTTLLAMNIYAEARGESDEGKSAVGQVVYNRVHGTTSSGKHVTWWGNDIKSVICAKYQFSWLNDRNSREYKNAVSASETAAWESCYNYAKLTIGGGGIANLSKNGKISDGYCNLSVCNPSWATDQNKITKIGSHTFFTTANLVGLDGAKPAEQQKPQTQTAQPAQAAPSTTQTQTTSTVASVYIVKSGDTLSAIANRFHVDGGYQALAKFNNISNPALINVGQEIKIPGTETETKAEAPAAQTAPAVTAAPQAATEPKVEEKKDEPVKEDTTANKTNETKPNASGASTQQAPAETVHTVQRGDTLSGIATLYHVNGGYQALAQYNGITNPNVLNVGQKIRIPGTASSATADKAAESKADNAAPANEVAKKEDKKEDAKPAAQAPNNDAGEKGYVVNISSTDTVNVRETPNTSKTPIGQAGLNKVVTILGETNGWYYVDTGVYKGYMHSNYIRKGEHEAVSESSLSAAISFATGKIGSWSYKNQETGMTYCQGFVADCAKQALGTRYCTASAMEARDAWKESSDSSKIPVGAAIYMNSNTKNGRKYGHVGFYVGGGEMCHVWGAVSKCKVSDINSATNGLCTFNSWGWNGGIPLSDKYE